MPNNIRVLVTAAGGPSGVNTLRLLKDEPGVTLFATDIDENAAGRFFAQEFETMARFKDRDAYAESLKNLIKKWNITVVVPTLAEELAVIEEVLKGIPVQVIVSPKSTVILCDDKRALYEWAQKNISDHVARWQTLDKELGWEADSYFIKPAHGRGGTGCRVISKNELKVFQKEVQNSSEWIAMEVLTGTEWTVDAYVTKQGKPVFIVPRERLEISSGISLKGKTVRNQEVIELSEKLLSALPSFGPVCIQWKKDKDGVVTLIEVNPRLAGGAMITALSGANPMKCLLQELRGEPVEPVVWEEKTVVGYYEYKPI